MPSRTNVRHKHVKNLHFRPAQSTDVLTVAFCAVAIGSYPQKREISRLWGYNNLIILLFLLTESISLSYGKK